MKTLYVAGDFDDQGGRFSKIGDTIFQEVRRSDMDYLNGGYFFELEEILFKITDYKLIYWFANVPNDKPKLVKEIKKKHKECVLVTSKRNVERRYTFQDLIFHAIGIKSNLFIEFVKKNSRYYGRVIDPLGNVFLDYSDNFTLAGKVLKKRAEELLGYTRVPSIKIGGAIEIPDEKEFLRIIRNYAKVFHNLIHAHPKATNRFFGNASFRCERGFPAFKHKDFIYVSKRNVDKRYIDRNAFVAVKAGELPVKYFGNFKPSTDTPINIKLYLYYPGVKYILHSHTYIKGAPFTRKIIPCGALEEVDEIVKLYPERKTVDFFVNLKGHGSLALAADIEFLRDIPYIPRPMPEYHSTTNTLSD